jgi:hypothetical protein
MIMNHVLSRENRPRIDPSNQQFKDAANILLRQHLNLDRRFYNPRAVQNVLKFVFVICVSKPVKQSIMSKDSGLVYIEVAKPPL